MRTSDDEKALRVTVSASDVRGLAYALTDLAGRIEEISPGEEEHRPAVEALLKSISRG